MPLQDNWHVEAICLHLEAVSRGEIQQLLINIPPGHAKSLLVSVFWPAWVWSWRPTFRGIFSAYSHDLAVRDSMRCRALIESDWYQQRFMRDWALRADSNRKQDFYNTVSGRRLAMSVDGKATGERGDCIVVDDPINAKDAPSKLEREKVIFWWDQVMSSRLNDLARGSRVIIMQRLHEEDLSGHVLAKGGYEHLCLPSEFERDRRSVTYIKRWVDPEEIPPGAERLPAQESDPPNQVRVKERFWQDPRKEEGELLFPSLFPEQVLAQAKKDLGSAGYAGQHAQRPAPAEGLQFKRAWWRFWRPKIEAVKTVDGVTYYAQDGLENWRAAPRRPRGCTDIPAIALPQLHRLVISVDAAFKGTDDSDFVVMTVWGAERANRYLLDMVRAKLTFNETLKAFRKLCAKWPLARKKLIEAKANGDAIVDTLQAEIPGIVPVDPEGGKEARASAIEPQVESGNVYLPEDAPWLADFIEEFASFPKGKHDDQVDSTSQALIEMGASSGVARARGLANL